MLTVIVLSLIFTSADQIIRYPSSPFSIAGLAHNSAQFRIESRLYAGITDVNRHVDSARLYWGLGQCWDSIVPAEFRPLESDFKV